MNCSETSDLVHTYSDGELDQVHALEVEKHLANCAACGREYENIKALRTTLKSGEQYFQAPPGLRQSIRQAIQGKDAAPRAGFAWWRFWEPLKVAIPVAGIAAVAVIVVMLAPWLTGRSASDQLVQEVTDGHVRSLMADHRTDIASSDQHTVKPWFEGKLDFAPPVVDLSERGFPLMGGRLDYLNNRAVAALVYQRHKHFINLFIWPASTSWKQAQRTAIRKGYNLIYWNQSGLTFWAISDLNQLELKEFVQLLK